MILKNIIKNLFGIGKKNLILNYCKDCAEVKHRALLYYKTDPFTKGYKDDYSHTNNWEITQIVKILNKQGFAVDIVDRSIEPDFCPEDKYDLFIGNAAGNSGRFYLKYAKNLKKAVKVFYAAGPNPDISNHLIEERYKFFYQRHPEVNQELQMRRTIDAGSQINDMMDNTDYIFCIGNEFSFSTYEQFNKKIFRIFPSSHPGLSLNINDLKSKNPKSFLYLGGSGNIVKGLDLLIEAFSELPDLDLYICAPNEAEFQEFYKDHFRKYKNIHFIGFIKIGQPEFLNIIKTIPFIISPSCSEGTATSVTTCMRCGLIPIVTKESGIDIGDFGFSIDDLRINSIKEQISKISQLLPDELEDRIFKTYKESDKYTQSGFSQSFESALLNIMAEKNL